jgi:hypothetical protein
MIGTAGVTVFVVVCCAGLPLVAGLLGGLTVTGVIGVGGAFVAFALAAVAAVALRSRRRAACERQASGSAKPPGGSQP